MKSIRGRLILVLILIGLGVYYLYPTVKYHQLSQQEQKTLVQLSNLSGIPLDSLAANIYRDDVDYRSQIESSSLPPEQKSEALQKLDFMRGEFAQDIKDYRPRAIKLGLDLQGGMYLVLEVDIVKMLDNIAKGKDDAYDRLLTELRSRTQGTDVDVFDVLKQIASRDHTSLNRYWGDPGQSDAAVITALSKAAEDAVDRSLQILRNRIDQFGVSEPSIAKSGNRRIILELPGVKDPQRALDLVGRTALLEFKIVLDPDRARDILTKLDQGIAARQAGAPLDTVAAKKDSSALAAVKTAGDTSKLASSDAAKKDSGATEASKLFSETAGDTAVSNDTTSRAHPLLSLFVGGSNNIVVPPENKSRVVRLLSSREYQKLIPSDVQFIWSAKAVPERQSGKEEWVLYLVKKQAEMNGSTLEDAQASIGSGYDPEQAGKPVVTLKFNRDGGRIFARVTGANVGKRMAIDLDDKVYMAPNIKDKISGGSAIITGLADMSEAQEIGIVLRSGALPAPVHVVEERTVGPSLGRDSIAAGQLCLFLAFISVALFMGWYYRLSGGLADLAMVINVFLQLAILAMFQFTLTMPGIAGIILTIGMAVDTNVLIFERIREELRLGKTIRAAIDTGFARAWTTIIDSHVSTAIAGIVLLIYGSGSIKGFALTLTVGITVNLFAAIVITRVVYDIYTEKRQLKTLSI
ncbi:MAG TPA: protein translocase subunit SecD [bacterium]|jgi:preprotein translocase subunit SecD